MGFVAMETCERGRLYSLYGWFFSAASHRRKQLIGYSAGVLPLLLLVGDYDQLTLTAFNSTTVTPGPTVTMEH